MLWQGDLKFVFSKLLQSVIDRELEKSEADLVLTSLVGVNRAFDFIWILLYPCENITLWTELVHK